MGRDDGHLSRTQLVGKCYKETLTTKSLSDLVNNCIKNLFYPICPAGLGYVIIV